jgi:hypothetical protein
MPRKITGHFYLLEVPPVLEKPPKDHSGNILNDALKHIPTQK